jgi:hypothetical protein
MKFQILAIAVCALIALASGQTSAAERQVLFHTQETPVVEVGESRIQGNVSGEVVEIEASIVGTGPEYKFLISATLGGTPLGSHSIELSRLPHLDLASASYFAQPETRTIKVEIRYSEERDCFVNDDGRDRLVVVFAEAQSPQDYTITYERCEPKLLLPTAQ